jgi:DegV family protein with EDD domain
LIFNAVTVGELEILPSQKIAIITDSTCDIPQDLIEAYSIHVVPQIVIWENKEYYDRLTLMPKDFYARLKTDPVRPTTAAATIQDFAKIYREVIASGAEGILVLTVSAAMSGTYQNALRAAQDINIPLQVIDSKGPTMSLGWQVLAAARRQIEGGDMQAMIDKTAEVRKSLVTIVGMDTIEYLQRGGRIGGAAKWIGSMLQIRPVVSINHHTGLVEPAGLARTHKKMAEMLYSKFLEKISTGSKMRVAVLHGDNPSEAEQLAERIRIEYAPLELIIQITGPVLGINTGPNALALCGYVD